MYLRKYKDVKYEIGLYFFNLVLYVYLNKIVYIYCKFI